MRDTYVGQVAIGGTLPIAAICRNGSNVPSTPDATPSYKIYGPGDLSTALVTGNLSASDQDSTTGYRTGSHAITNGNGFAVGEMCVIVIEYAISSTNYKDTQRFLVS